MSAAGSSAPFALLGTLAQFPLLQPSLLVICKVVSLPCKATFPVLHLLAAFLDNQFLKAL